MSPQNLDKRRILLDENNITANKAAKAKLFDSTNTTTNHDNVC